MTKRVRDLRWGVEQRLEFIEFRLFWEGGINRSDITNYFDVSVPQASKDLSQYQSLAPDNIAYNKSEKRYFATNHFRPRFLKPDADRYLSELRSIGGGGLGQAGSWLQQIPTFDTVPMPRRNVDPGILRATIDAIRNQTALEIRYQSLSPHRPRPIWRWISPHALAFSGQRWHARALCHIDHIYKDFLLPRFLDMRRTATGEANVANDTAWNEIVNVALKPHPALTADQKRVVSNDFGMKSERLNIRVRLALLYHLLRRLNVDFDSQSRPARDQNIVLVDPDEMRCAVKRLQVLSSS